MTYKTNETAAVSALSQTQIEMLETANSLISKFLSEVPRSQSQSQSQSMNQSVEDIKSRIAAKVFKSREEEQVQAPVRSQGTDIPIFEETMDVSIWATATTRSKEDQGAWVIRAYNGTPHSFTRLFTERGLANGGGSKVMSYSCLKSLERVRELCPNARNVTLYATFGIIPAAINRYAEQWEDQDWRTNGGSPVFNREHYEQILALKRNWNVKIHAVENLVGKPKEETEQWLQLPEKFREEYRDCVGMSWNTLSRSLIGRIIDHREEE